MQSLSWGKGNPSLDGSIKRGRFSLPSAPSFFFSIKGSCSGLSTKLQLCFKFREEVGVVLPCWGTDGDRAPLRGQKPWWQVSAKPTRGLWAVPGAGRAQGRMAPWQLSRVGWSQGSRLDRSAGNPGFLDGNLSCMGAGCSPASLPWGCLGRALNGSLGCTCVCVCACR